MSSRARCQRCLEWTMVRQEGSRFVSVTPCACDRPEGAPAREAPVPALPRTAAKKVALKGIAGVAEGAARAIHFTVHGKPLSLNNLYANVPGVGRVKTKEGRAWKKRIAAAAKRAAGAVVLEGPVSVELWVYFDSRRPDLDNAVKPVLDALTGVLWKDDRQVARLLVVKGLDRQMPRVEVEVMQEPREGQRGRE